MIAIVLAVALASCAVAFGAVGIWATVTGNSALLDRQTALAGVLSLVLPVILAAIAMRRWASRRSGMRRDVPLAASSWLPVSDRPGMISLRVPELQEDYIRGRDELVRDLAGLDRRRAWWRGRAARVWVLCGMGGSGKTTVALAVARRLQERGVRVWWVSAATRTDLVFGMRQLAAQVGATEAEIDRAWGGRGSAPDLLWRGLAECPDRWLLVIDGADDSTTLALAGEPVTAGRGWLRRVHRPGAILVTSREGSPETWTASPGGEQGWCRLQPVGMLPVGDGAQVLLDHAGPQAGTRKQAADLARRLGGLPLALGLAGRYLAKASQLRLPGAITTFADYQQALDTGAVAAMFDHPAEVLSNAQARRAIDRTWELSLDLLDQRGLGQARILLRLLAVLADSPIPCRMLDARVMAASPLFPQLGTSQLSDLLQGLAGMGLVDLRRVARLPADTAASDAIPRTLGLHPLIRDTSRYHLDQSGQAAITLALAAALLHAAATSAGMDPPEQPASWPYWRLLAPHALYLVDTVLGATDPDPATMQQSAAAALRATDYLGATGLYTTARDAADTIHRACHQILGEEHPLTLTARADLARWTGQAGDAETARDQFAALLPIRQRVSGAEHPDTLVVRADLARWTGQAGDAETARDQFAALLPIRQRVSGAEHPDTLVVRADLARWTGQAGDAETARDQFAALLPIRQRVSGAEHPDTLVVRADLARWTGQAGDAETARDQFAALLPIRQRVSGAEHPDTLVVRADLARWTGQAGDAETARDQFAALLPIRQRVSGAEHPDTLVVRADLARWTGQAGDAETARDQFAALAPVYKKVLGAEHPDTLIVRADLAYWTGQAGDAITACEQFAELPPICDRVLGAGHPDTLAVRADLARWTEAALAAAKAEADSLHWEEAMLYAESVDAYEQTYASEEDHRAVAQYPVIRAKQAALQAQVAAVVTEAARPTVGAGRRSSQAGDAVAARDQLTALLPQYERACGPEHPNTLDIRNNLAWWTGCAGDAVAARDQLTTLLPQYERACGPEHPSTLDIRNNLAWWTGCAGTAVSARDQLTILLPVQKQVSGAGHPDSLAVQANLAGWTRKVERGRGP